jgi:hypothetical protein
MRAHPFRFRWTALMGTKDAHTFQISRFTHKGLRGARHPTGRPPSALSEGFAVHFLAIGECRVGDLGHGRVTSNFKGLTASLQEPAL